DGKSVAVGSGRLLVLLDTASGKEVRRWSTPAGLVRAVGFAPDGKALATAGWNDALRLWDVETGKELRQFGEQAREVRALAFSADGTLLASAEDHAVRL